MRNTYCNKKNSLKLLVAAVAISASLSAAGSWQTTVVSGGGKGFELDGKTPASYNLPMGITLDSLGNIYVAEWNGARVSKINPKTGNILATTGGFANPEGVTVDNSGNVYMTDPNSPASGFAGIAPSGGPVLVEQPGKDVQKITFDVSGNPTVSTIAYGAYEMYRDGTTAHVPYVLNPPYGNGNDALLYAASHLTYNNGNLYVSDFSNIRKIDLNAGTVSTIAGGGYGNQGYADGVGPSAQFFDPMGIAVNSKGVVYVADQYNKAIRKLVQNSVSGEWTVSTIVRDTANLISLNGLAIDSNDNIYVAATNHGKIYKIVDNGGNGTASYLFDSPAYGIACDSSGNLYTSDSDGFIRKHTLVPVANDDTISGDENTTITGSLNVIYTGSNALNYSLIEGENKGPNYGHVEIDPKNGTYTYTPNLEYHGADSFTYQVDDGKGGSAQATINITVNPLNDAVAMNDDIELAQGAKISAAFKTYDYDKDKLTYSVITGPIYGTVVVNDDGTYTYTPNRDYNGEDSFTYQVDDGRSGPAPQARVNITVNQNAIPVASNVSIPSASGDRVLVPITSVTSGYTGTLHATDTDGSIKSYSIFTSSSTYSNTINTAAGTVTLIDPVKGTYTYTCNNPNFTGTDSFQFVATDDVGAISDPATVTVTVSKPSTSQLVGYYSNQETAAISNLFNQITTNPLSQDTLNAAVDVVKQGYNTVVAAANGTISTVTTAVQSALKSLLSYFGG